MSRVDTYTLAPGLAGAVALLGVCLAAAPTASAATCFERLEKGALAQVAGDHETAEQVFRQALEVEACRAPPLGPLLRFSLGRILVDGADHSPERACEAEVHLSVARDADDANVAQGAAAVLSEARAICLKARAAEDWGEAGSASGEPVAAAPSAAPGPAARPSPEVDPERLPAPTPVAEAQRHAPPASIDPPAGSTSAEPTSPRRWSFGPRVEGGVSGLVVGQFTVGELMPGITVGFGLAVERQLLDTMRLFVEPAVTVSTLGYRVDADGGGQKSVIWRRTIIEATAGAAWLPRAGALALRLGARGGWVLDATEAPALFSDDGTPIDMAWVSVDAVMGVSYEWPLAGAGLRVSADVGLGLLRLNAADDAAGWYGYRGALAVAALF